MDDTMQRYNEVTLFDMKNDRGVANAMRVGTKEKNTKLYVKIIKLVTLANLTHRFGFLEEVSFVYTKSFYGNVVH